jgi:hypothetical protein
VRSPSSGEDLVTVFSGEAVYSLKSGKYEHPTWPRSAQARRTDAATLPERVMERRERFIVRAEKAIL